MVCHMLRRCLLQASIAAHARETGGNPEWGAQSSNMRRGWFRLLKWQKQRYTDPTGVSSEDPAPVRHVHNKYLETHGC